jgi:hypothetical protein
MQLQLSKLNLNLKYSKTFNCKTKVNSLANSVSHIQEMHNVTQTLSESKKLRKLSPSHSGGKQKLDTNN